MPERSAPPTACPCLLDIQAVARRLDVSPKTVRRMIARGELPVHRIGRLIRISPQDLDACLARSRQK